MRNGKTRAQIQNIARERMTPNRGESGSIYGETESRRMIIRNEEIEKARAQMKT